MPKTSAQVLDFKALKTKQRKTRNKFPEAVGLRVHRAISWLGRAETEKSDYDVRFILLWVGFNSAYASEIGAETAGERDSEAYRWPRLWEEPRAAILRLLGLPWTTFRQDFPRARARFIDSK